MINFSKYNCILWDFDGVLMDSMPVREHGFKEVLTGYDEDQVAALLEYHRKNGGLSRYVKFRYFFETIRKEKITEDKIQSLTQQFSLIMLELLMKPNLLIQDPWNFIERHYKDVDMHIVSGSDGIELNTICKTLNLSTYFKSIVGSPTPKQNLVGEILQRHRYEKVVLIGDSFNDLEAAELNGIDFLGYNNPSLKNLTHGYIDSFNGIEVLNSK
jgi:phosphoglycolate phosphatase-like HAD superfamily hydrolase